MFKTRLLSSMILGLFLILVTGIVIFEPAVALGKSPDAFKQNKRLGVGINLSNALEAPSEGEWDVVLKEEYFKIIKDAGFDSVRLPVRWSVHALEEAPYTIDKVFFDRVDWAIQNAIKNDLYIIVNMHNYHELLSDTTGHLKRFYAIWQQIAERFKDYPDSVLFEPLNEPSDKMGLQRWNQVLKESLAVIRKSNPRRTIVVGPYKFNQIEFLSRLEIPEYDRNIIVSLHYYEPREFTHQGAPWLGEGSQAWLGTKWTGTEQEKKAITRAFDMAKAWGKKFNRPINLGEFGAYEKADMESRACWTRFMAETAAECGFSRLYWGFCSNFGAYDPEKNAWREPLLNAILLKK